MATHYRSHPAVIGADLHNEPHGAATWVTGDTGGILEDDWTTVNQPKLDLLRTYQCPRIGVAAG